uniref:Uncharacterized protein n=1 Tax=Glossina pallidipes TaxID=7398 RepID=A0A1A9ZXB2_GLOPL
MKSSLYLGTLLSITYMYFFAIVQANIHPLIYSDNQRFSQSSISRSKTDNSKKYSKQTKTTLFANSQLQPELYLYICDMFICKTQKGCAEDMTALTFAYEIEKKSQGLHHKVFHRLAAPHTRVRMSLVVERLISDNSNQNERERDEMESYYNEKQTYNK